MGRKTLTVVSFPHLMSHALELLIKANVQEQVAKTMAEDNYPVIVLSGGATLTTVEV